MSSEPAQTAAAVEVVSEVRATIGESPLWRSSEQALYWMDIKAPALRRFDPATGEDRSWPVTSDIGGFALWPDGTGALVALRFGLFKLDFANGGLTDLAHAPFDPRVFRFNEGACDSQGRFWIGVMCDPLNGTDGTQKSALHSFTLTQGLREESDASDLHNGMAWSEDERTFFLAHSNEQTIFAHPYDAATGAMGAPSVFADLPQSLGIPDGAAMDVEGGYWSACHGGGRLRRYAPNGALDREILLPVSQPTMCAFGGPNLEDLYITSARDRMTPEQLNREPLAGALMRIRPGVRGLPRFTEVR